MATKTVSVDLPEELWELAGKDSEDVSLELKRALVLDLVRKKRISAMGGAKLMGMHLTDFVEVMSEHGIPYFTQPPRDPEELARAFQPAER